MKHFAIALALAAGAWAALTGCSGSPSDEFREFGAQQPLEERGTDVAEAEGQPSPHPETDRVAQSAPPQRSSAPGTASVEAPVEAPRPAREPSAEGDQIAALAPAAIPQVNGVGPALANPAVQSRPGEPAVDNQSAEPREIKLLVPEKSFRTEGPEGAVRVSYDDIDLLKVLNMEPVPVDAVDHFPKWLKDLDGKRLRIRGFMFPPFQETDIPAFVLARDNQICCFGRDPKRYDVIDVVMREGVTTNYIQNRPFDVVGVFHIAPESSEGELYQLYVIDDAIVIDN